MAWLGYDGRKRTVKVAALVLGAFGPPRPTPKHCIRHMDGNSLNDSIDNLQWGTYTENNRDRITHGTIPRGEKMWKAKLSDQSVREIRSAQGVLLRDLAKRYGVSETQISNIRRGKQWRHVA